MKIIANQPGVTPANADYPNGYIEDGLAFVSEGVNRDFLETFQKILRLQGETANGNFDNETNGFQLLRAVNRQNKSYGELKLQSIASNVLTIAAEVDIYSTVQVDASLGITINEIVFTDLPTDTYPEINFFVENIGAAGDLTLENNTGANGILLPSDKLVVKNLEGFKAKYVDGRWAITPNIDLHNVWLDWVDVSGSISANFVANVARYRLNRYYNRCQIELDIQNNTLMSYQNTYPIFSTVPTEIDPNMKAYIPMLMINAGSIDFTPNLMVHNGATNFVLNYLDTVGISPNIREFRISDEYSV
jgi:hypothetical protein